MVNEIAREPSGLLAALLRALRVPRQRVPDRPPDEGAAREAASRASSLAKTRLGELCGGPLPGPVGQARVDLRRHASVRGRRDGCQLGERASPPRARGGERVTEVVEPTGSLPPPLRPAAFPALWSARNAFRRDCGLPRTVVKTSASAWTRGQAQRGGLPVAVGAEQSRHGRALPVAVDDPAEDRRAHARKRKRWHFDEPCFATTYWWLRSTPASFVLTRGRLANDAQGESATRAAYTAVDDDRPPSELRVRVDLPAPRNQAADLRPQARCARGAGRVDDLDRAPGAGPDIHLERRVVVPGHDRRERHR